MQKMNQNSLTVASLLQAERSEPRRELTVLKLQWIAERARKCQNIKNQLAAGTYSVDSRSIARAVLAYNVG